MAELPGSSGGVDLNVSPQDEVALGDEPESDEDFIQELRSRKGLRAFTLLPVSTSFVPMDVAFDGFTLQGFCARLYNRTWSNPVGIPVGAHGVLARPQVVTQLVDFYLRRAFAVV